MRGGLDLESYRSRDQAAFGSIVAGALVIYFASAGPIKVPVPAWKNVDRFLTVVWQLVSYVQPGCASGSSGLS